MRCRSLVLLSALLMLLTGCAQEAPAEPIFAIVEGVEIPRLPRGPHARVGRGGL